MHNGFTFTHVFNEETLTYTFPAETWHEALEKFIAFLGSVHGYSVKERVAVDMNPWAVNTEGWSGPTFESILQEYREADEAFPFTSDF